MSRGVRVAAVAVAVLALCAALAAALARSENRYAGFNSVRSPEVVLELERGDEVCQAVETVPEDTAAVEVVAVTGGTPGPPLRATVSSHDGDRIAAGRQPGGYGDGKLAVPVTEIGYTVPEASVCISSTGPGKVGLMGVSTAPAGLYFNDEGRPGLLTIAYRRAGEESLFALLPAVAHRLGLGKTTIAGSWTMWALLGLFLGSSGLALALVLARDFGEEAR